MAAKVIQGLHLLRIKEKLITRKTAVDQAYMPLFQFYTGVLKGGAFHGGSIFLFKISL